MIDIPTKGEECVCGRVCGRAEFCLGRLVVPTAASERGVEFLGRDESPAVRGVDHKRQSSALRSHAKVLAF